MVMTSVTDGLKKWMLERSRAEIEQIIHAVELQHSVQIENARFAPKCAQFKRIEATTLRGYVLTIMEQNPNKRSHNGEYSEWAQLARTGHHVYQVFYGNFPHPTWVGRIVDGTFTAY